MITIVCFKWKPLNNAYRSHFTAAAVRTLRSMVARHYPDPHEFVCITDDPENLHLEPAIKTIPLWTDHAGLTSPHGAHQPSCYRRLRVFAKDAGEWLAPRFCCLDLDTVIVGDLRPILNRTEDFVIWGETDPRSFYNGSMFMLTAGARAKVWETFNPRTSPREAIAAGRFGSDQGWISHCLGRGQAMWGRADGVYSWRVHLKNGAEPLPSNARIVMFHGRVDPWSAHAQSTRWVRENYR